MYFNIILPPTPRTTFNITVRHVTWDSYCDFGLRQRII
jgi:hypothetical protein